MVQNEKSIILVSEDAQFNDRISALLRRESGFAVTACNATLAGMNGKASDLAKTSELIIFQSLI